MQELEICKSQSTRFGRQFARQIGIFARQIDGNYPKNPKIWDFRPPVTPKFSRGRSLVRVNHLAACKTTSLRALPATTTRPTLKSTNWDRRKFGEDRGICRKLQPKIRTKWQRMGSQHCRHLYSKFADFYRCIRRIFYRCNRFYRCNSATSSAENCPAKSTIICQQIQKGKRKPEGIHLTLYVIPWHPTYHRNQTAETCPIPQ